MTRESVYMASNEEQKEFMEKLNNPDYFALEHKIVIKAVEFIPYKEFKKKKIKAEDYSTERDKYIQEHSTNLHAEMKNFKSVIAERGLYVGMMSQAGKKYNLIESMLKDFEKLSPEKLLETLKSLADDSTPHQKNSNTSETGK